MGIDHLKNYSTEAFRFYARAGSSEKYKRKLYLEALEDQARRENGTGIISKPTESMVIRAEAKVDEKISEIMDLVAVEQTIGEFVANGKNEIVQVIQAIYFIDSEKPLKKGNIKDRVIRASMDLCLSEATIYRCLKKARILFAFNRGLRL